MHTYTPIYISTKMIHICTHTHIYIYTKIIQLEGGEFVVTNDQHLYMYVYLMCTYTYISVTINYILPNIILIYTC